MRLKAGSVRLRLSLWYVAVLTAIIFVFALGIYFFVRASLLRHIDNHLDRDFDTVVRMARQGPEELKALTRHGNVFLFRVAEGSAVRVETEGWARAGLGLGLAGLRSASSSSVRAPDGQPYRVKALTITSAGAPLLIAVAHEEQTFGQSMHSLTMILLLGIPAALILAVGGGYFLAGRALSPIGAMAAKAREITAERLSERLPVENPHDEFGRLAMVFNETFLRLEDSFARLRRFTADASHELRTPLTAIRSVGEVGMHENMDAASCREVIGSMLEETDRLTKLVDSLLTLSRADAGTVPFRKEGVDLAGLAFEVSECLQVLAEEKEQSLTVAAPAPVSVEGDRATLRQALINLLDNAIKFTPAGGKVEISVRTTPGGEAVLAVSDDGPGIAGEHREKIYERFYRVDEGRSREVGGAGLGLSIVKWAVENNGGRIELDSAADRGSTFRVVFPLSTEDGPMPGKGENLPREMQAAGANCPR
jgi:heavy metal sensor kinase